MYDEGLFLAIKQYCEVGKITTCGKCKYYDKETDIFGTCLRLSGKNLMKIDDFCSYGEASKGDGNETL